MIALKKASSDNSAYVRKATAHCLSKILAVDPTQKDDVVDIIDHLLHDKAVMVIGSTLAAFEEICPEKLQLLHGVYRRLCQVVPDMDDWGQVTTINLLTRYARTQFPDPNAPTEAQKQEQNTRKHRKKSKKKKSGFYSDESDASGSDDDDTYVMQSSSNSVLSNLDPDHKALIESALPLLRSRNSAVVSAVANMYFYIGPKDRHLSARVGQALLRHTRGHREIQYFMLKNIAAIANERPDIFQKNLKDFYAADSEPPFVRQMKVDIMAAIATEKNSSLILSEFSHYVKDDDKSFVRHTIKAVGRVANRMPSVSDRCLKGLMGLLATGDGGVIAEAILVLRQLVQQDTRHGNILVKVGRMLTKVAEPSARAAIVWIIGEFQSKAEVAKLAPDSLRIIAKSFRKEHPAVKVQAVNLATKLSLREDVTKVQKNLCYYVLELAKYDADYDLRDRTRMLKAMLNRVRAEEKSGKKQEASSTTDINAQGAENLLSTDGTENEAEGQASNQEDVEEVANNGGEQRAPPHEQINGVDDSKKTQKGSSERERVLKILNEPKPPPLAEGGDHQSGLTLGSLSFVLGHPIRGYKSVPEWTSNPTDPSAREPQERKAQPGGRPKKTHHRNKKVDEDTEEEESSEEEGDEESGSSDEDDDESDDEEEEGSGSGTESGEGSESEEDDGAAVVAGEGSESSDDDEEDDD